MSSILQRWEGKTKQYNKYRPGLPKDLITLLSKMTGAEQINCVVDLGCGTGNSTRSWAGFARSVIGIEPSPEMILTAKDNSNSNHAHISYLNRYANDTGLPYHSADIVFASSAIHWMEPASTMKEVTRILKAGGIFSFFGTSFPPVTPFLPIDKAYFTLADMLNERKGDLPKAERWEWDKYINHIREQNIFAFHRHFYVHQHLFWGAAEYINWLNTTNMSDLCQISGPEMTTHFEKFQDAIHTYFGSKKHSCLFVYNVHAYQ